MCKYRRGEAMAPQFRSFCDGSIIRKIRPDSTLAWFEFLMVSDCMSGAGEHARFAKKGAKSLNGSCMLLHKQRALCPVTLSCQGCSRVSSSCAPLS